MNVLLENEHYQGTFSFTYVCLILGLFDCIIDVVHGTHMYAYKAVGLFHTV